jgi:hypothetical protein
MAFHRSFRSSFSFYEALFLELLVLGKAGLHSQSLEPSLVILMFFQETAIFGVQLRHVLRMRLAHRSILLGSFLGVTGTGGNKPRSESSRLTRRWSTTSVPVRGGGDLVPAPLQTPRENLGPIPRPEEEGKDERGNASSPRPGSRLRRRGTPTGTRRKRYDLAAAGSSRRGLPCVTAAARAQSEPGAERVLGQHPSVTEHLRIRGIGRDLLDVEPS